MKLKNREIKLIYSELSKLSNIAIKGRFKFELLKLLKTFQEKVETIDQSFELEDDNIRIKDTRSNLEILDIEDEIEINKINYKDLIDLELSAASLFILEKIINMEDEDEFRA
ncbi:hypothetical protein ACKA04_02345 [Helcococcus kunzii]|uniref:hypothetical protein n=1 Tax=Helcococcus kunzii TaxID=40091 RepID=UPI0038A902B9